MKQTVLNPDYSLIEKRPTWGYVSTPELAKILSVSLQSINNFLLRGKICAPEPNPRFKGNRNWWNIARLRSQLESRPEEEIHWEWIRQNLPAEANEFKSIAQAQFLVKHCYKILGVERP